MFFHFLEHIKFYVQESSVFDNRWSRQNSGYWFWGRNETNH